MLSSMLLASKCMVKVNGKCVSTAKRRIWRKLHLAIDAATHEIIDAQVSLETVADNEVLPALLNPLRRKFRQVSADGAYNTKACHKLLRQKPIPPRSNAGYWEPGLPRNEAVDALKAGELKRWKLMNNYHQRSLSETAMYRYKQLISAKLSLRDYNGQVGEALAGVKQSHKTRYACTPDNPEGLEIIAFH